MYFFSRNLRGLIKLSLLDSFNAILYKSIFSYSIDIREDRMIVCKHRLG
jgi:hypothetical protein